MPAQIIAFPYTNKTTAPKLIVHRSFDLVNSWDSKFFNPYLNSIYTETVPYVERWYLETRHCLTKEVKSNILSQLILDKVFCKEFIDACGADIAICTKLIDNPEYEVVAAYWLKKLKRWNSNFLACYNHKPELN